MTDTVGGPTRHLFLPPSPLPAFTRGREQGRLRGTAVTEGRALGRGPGLGLFLCGHPDILNNFPFAFVFYESKSNGTTERAPGDSEPRLTPLTSPRNPLSAAVSPDLFQGAASSELGGQLGGRSATAARDMGRVSRRVPCTESGHSARAPRSLRETSRASPTRSQQETPHARRAERERPQETGTLSPCRLDGGPANSVASPGAGAGPSTSRRPSPLRRGRPLEPVGPAQPPCGRSSRAAGNVCLTHRWFPRIEQNAGAR